MRKNYFIGGLLLALSINTLASGSLGGSYGGGATANARPTDPLYEAGKALSKGRNNAYKGVKVCIKPANSNEVVKIRRKHLAQYKRTTNAALANDLYNCANPDQKILSVMGRNDMRTLLYYIDKRFKLRLK